MYFFNRHMNMPFSCSDWFSDYVDHQSISSYKCSFRTGLFTVHLPKLVEGEDFPDLDLVTKLLAPKGKSHVPHAGIEVVSETCYNYNEDKDEEDFHWEIPQEFYDEKVSYVLIVLLLKKKILHPCIDSPFLFNFASPILLFL